LLPIFIAIFGVSVGYTAVAQRKIILARDLKLLRDQAPQVALGQQTSKERAGLVIVESFSLQR
jgi:hypothetical protein